MKKIDKKLYILIVMLIISSLILGYGYYKENKENEELQNKLEEQKKQLEAKNITKCKVADSKSCTSDSLHVGCNGYY